MNVSFALKPAPASFYGSISIRGNEARSGTIIEAYDSNHVLCGRFVVQQEGKYGLLICVGDDPSTVADEGAVNGENLTFYINGIRADSLSNLSWQSGTLNQIDLFLGSIQITSQFREEPTEIHAYKGLVIKIISIIGSIVLVIVFLWIYNKR